MSSAFSQTPNKAFQRTICRARKIDFTEITPVVKVSYLGFGGGAVTQPYGYNRAMGAPNGVIPGVLETNGLPATTEGRAEIELIFARYSTSALFAIPLCPNLRRIAIHGWPSGLPTQAFYPNASIEAWGDITGMRYQQFSEPEYAAFYISMLQPYYTGEGLGPLSAGCMGGVGFYKWHIVGGTPQAHVRITRDEALFGGPGPFMHVYWATNGIYSQGSALFVATGTPGYTEANYIIHRNYYRNIFLM